MKSELASILLKRRFNKEEIKYLLSLEGEDMQELFAKANETKLKYLDNYVHLRGLIEYSNICEKNCLYCGLRCKNLNVCHYTIKDEDVLASVRLAMDLKYGSIAIQSGEQTSKEFTKKISQLIRTIKQISDNKIGITLSCGEQTEDVYKEWFDAGAHRYLLRIESSNKDLYYKIHPKDAKHSYENRLQCIDTLMKIGYQTGTGCMVGLPFQTMDDLADDILFFKEKDVAMVGLGPFIPHQDTPLWQFKDMIPDKATRMSLTLKTIAVIRLMMPEINMVASTANQTISKDGRKNAIYVGANVIMPNLSPNTYRENYLIYPDKANVKDKPIECKENLELELQSINHKILYDTWGDSKAFLNKTHKNQQ